MSRSIGPTLLEQARNGNPATTVVPTASGAAMRACEITTTGSPGTASSTAITASAPSTNDVGELSSHSRAVPTSRPPLALHPAGSLGSASASAKMRAVPDPSTDCTAGETTGARRTVRALARMSSLSTGASSRTNPPFRRMSKLSTWLDRTVCVLSTRPADEASVTDQAVNSPLPRKARSTRTVRGSPVAMHPIHHRSPLRRAMIACESGVPPMNRVSCHSGAISAR